MSLTGSTTGEGGPSFQSILSTLHLKLEWAIENELNRHRQLVDRAREERRSMDQFLGTWPLIRNLSVLAAKVVASESPVLIISYGDFVRTA